MQGSNECSEGVRTLCGEESLGKGGTPWEMNDGASFVEPTYMRMSGGSQEGVSLWDDIDENNIPRIQCQASIHSVRK